ncbi:MAG: TIGR03905 family protein [Candidatus Epulonipiscium fishelsonii]|nr:MAG: TIGR03905 family protein [Epulopiscium sp. AS2M-Bin002]
MQKLWRYTRETVNLGYEVQVIDNKITKVSFVNGCAGNAIGLAALIEGMEIDEAIKRLKGIDCKGKGTSCPDQLSIALERYKQKDK